MNETSEADRRTFYHCFTKLKAGCLGQCISKPLWPPPLLHKHPGNRQLASQNIPALLPTHLGNSVRNIPSLQKQGVPNIVLLVDLLDRAKEFIHLTKQKLARAKDFCLFIIKSRLFYARPIFFARFLICC